MSARRAATSLLLALVVASVAPRAHADPSSEEQALADVRFREGRELLDKQRYDDACAKFEESEHLWPRGGTVLNLAACREKQGKPATAWAAYTRALGLAQKEGRADREELAKNKIAALQAELSWLVIEVPQELDVPGAVVTRDGTPIGRGAWGVSVPVDPGRHVVVANAPGVPPIEAVVDVGPHGDRKTVLIPHSGAAPHVLPPSPQFPTPGLGFGSLRGRAELGQPGVVRLHVDTSDANVRLFMLPSFAGLAVGAVGAVGHPICTTPCDMIVDGRDGQFLYFDGDGISRSSTFFISDRKGDLVAHVAPGSSLLSSLGGTVAVLGGTGAVTGLVLLLTGALIRSADTGTDQSGSGLAPAGGVTLGISGGVLAAGIAMLIVGRTTVKLDNGTAPKTATGPRLTSNGVAIAF